MLSTYVFQFLNFQVRSHEVYRLERNNWDWDGRETSIRSRVENNRATQTLSDHISVPDLAYRSQRVADLLFVHFYVTASYGESTFH